MKILFLGQPSKDKFTNIAPPIGLCYLSATLKKEGYDSKVIDACSYSWKKIKSILREEKPDVVGIQCVTIERGQSYKLAKIVKKELPKCIIIFGGQHASCFPEQMFKLAPIDYVVIGEGELTIIELIKAIEKGNDLYNIKGLAFKEAQNKIKINPSRELINDLDIIPFPDYSAIDLSQYATNKFGEKVASASMITSRGCIYNCAFCSSTHFWGRHYRVRSAENVIKELSELYDKGIRQFDFIEDNFIVDKERMIKICQWMIDKKDIRFFVTASIRIMDEERLKWLKDAGCFALNFGMESGCDKILKNISKYQTKEDIKKAYLLTKKYGIKIIGSLIVGCPGETKETIKETAELLNEIYPDRLAYGGILWVLPGTPIYELSKKQGIISDDTWLHTDKDIFYTAEHNLRQLKHLQKLLLYYQARKRNFKQKLLFIVRYIHLSMPISIKRIFRIIYYKFLPSM